MTKAELEARLSELQSQLDSKEQAKETKKVSPITMSLAEQADIELCEFPAEIDHFVVTKRNGFFKAIPFNAENQELRPWFDISDRDEGRVRLDQTLRLNQLECYVKPNGYTAIRFKKRK